MRSSIHTQLHSVDGEAVASRRCKHCHCLQQARLACRVMTAVIQSAYTGACVSCMYILHSAKAMHAAHDTTQTQELTDFTND